MHFPGFQEVAEQLLSLLDTRLSAQDLDWFRSYLWAGEEGLLADELVQTLIADQLPIGPVERDLLADLLGYFDAGSVDAATYPNIVRPDQALSSLNVVEHL